MATKATKRTRTSEDQTLLKRAKEEEEEPVEKPKEEPEEENEVKRHVHERTITFDSRATPYSEGVNAEFIKAHQAPCGTIARYLHAHGKKNLYVGFRQRHQPDRYVEWTKYFFFTPKDHTFLTCRVLEMHGDTEVAGAEFECRLEVLSMADMIELAKNTEYTGFQLPHVHMLVKDRTVYVCSPDLHPLFSVMAKIHREIIENREICLKSGEYKLDCLGELVRVNSME